jgi:hypothetical protein
MVFVVPVFVVVVVDVTFFRVYSSASYILISCFNVVGHKTLPPPSTSYVELQFWFDALLILESKRSSNKKF